MHSIACCQAFQSEVRSRGERHVKAAAGSGPECSGDGRSQLFGERRIRRRRAVALSDDRCGCYRPNGGKHRQRRSRTVHALATVVAARTRAAVHRLFRRPVLVTMLGRGVVRVRCGQCHRPRCERIGEHQGQCEEHYAQPAYVCTTVPTTRLRAICVHATMILRGACWSKRL